MWNSDDKGSFRQLQSKSIQAGSPAGLQTLCGDKAFCTSELEIQIKQRASQANFEHFAFHLMSLKAARVSLSFSCITCHFQRCFAGVSLLLFFQFPWEVTQICSVSHVFFKAFVQLDSPPLPSASKADLQESFRDMTLHYFKSLALLIFMAWQVTKDYMWG